MLFGGPLSKHYRMVSQHPAHLPWRQSNISHLDLDIFIILIYSQSKMQSSYKIFTLEATTLGINWEGSGYFAKGPTEELYGCTNGQI